ncbi:hypothetical protein ES708_30531 [subsurface metagenome]
MAKPEKPLLSLGARGTIADTLTFQKRGQLTIARRKPIPKDPESDAQLAWRQVYRDAVDAWRALNQQEKDAWRGVYPGLTAYQCFMKSELKYAPPPVPIDIGEGAINRAYSSGYGGWTIVMAGNPANASGTIKTAEIWSNTDLAGVRIGIFYTTNGNTLKCRSSAIIGAVTGGSKQTFPGLSLSVEVGDFIGIYYDTGNIERDTGAAGMWRVNAENIDPGDESVYEWLVGQTLSLYGIGEGSA